MVQLTKLRHSYLNCRIYLDFSPSLFPEFTLHSLVTPPWFFQFVTVPQSFLVIHGLDNFEQHWSVILNVFQFGFVLMFSYYQFEVMHFQQEYPFACNLSVLLHLRFCCDKYVTGNHHSNQDVISKRTFPSFHKVPLYGFAVNTLLALDNR